MPDKNKEARFLLNQLTETLTTLITNLYVSTGLIGILIAMAIESCCIPLPSELVMPLAGVMIASGKILHSVNPLLSIVLVALAGALGCLIGSMAAYGIGYSGGRPLLLKYGRYVLISQHDADLADRFFQRWGSPTAFFSRLLPVVRTYISLPAGISKMPFVKFCVYSFLGSFPWCLLLAYVGTILGNNLDRLSPIFHSLDVVIVVALVILIALYIWRHIRNDRKARAAHALAEATEAAAAAQAAAVAAQEVSAPNPWSQQPRGQFKGSVQPQWGQPPSPQSQQQQWGQGQPQQGWGQGQVPPQAPRSQPQPPQPPQPSQQQQIPSQSQWSQADPQWGKPPQQQWPPQADGDTIRRR